MLRFFTEKSSGANELKHQCPQGQQNSSSVSLHKTWCFMIRYGGT